MDDQSTTRVRVGIKGIWLLYCAIAAILFISAMPLLKAGALPGAVSASENASSSIPFRIGDAALVILDSDTPNEFWEIVRYVSDNGGKIVHVHPPHVLVGYFPRTLDSRIAAKSGVAGVYRTPLDPRSIAHCGKNAVWAVEAWNNNFMGQAEAKGLVHKPGDPEPGPILGDCLHVDDRRLGDESADKPDEEAGVPSPPYGAGFYDTSEYMMGSVAVGILFPESNGAIDPNLEDWTDTELSNCISEIAAAMDWWDAREPNANLLFVYEAWPVSQGYEPITHPQSEEYLWINAVMDVMGYTSGSRFDRTFAYANDLRDTYGADWTFVVFVVDSSNDTDGYFSDGYFAYAYLGGPFIVMTYDNDGYGIANMDAVTAHEMGHTFYALDQYYSAQVPPTERSGYLNVENQNTEYGGSSDEPSIMRGQVYPYTIGAVDPYARGQIGWRDTDEDGIMDILDFEPSSYIDPCFPDPTFDNTPTYTGTSYTTATYPNNNPYGWGNDITINKVYSVQFRVDGGAWQTAQPVDGSFDGPSETFTFTAGPLADGTHTFEVRSQNTVGIWDESPYPSDILTITAASNVSVSCDPLWAATRFQLGLDSPHNYPNNFDQTWSIRVPGVSSLRVHFSSIDVEDGFDFVAIYNESNSLIESYSGLYADLWSDSVDGDVIRIRLLSDSSVNYYGFKVDALDVGTTSISSFEILPGSLVYLDTPRSEGDCFFITKSEDPSGYTFDHWEIDGSPVSSGSSFSSENQHDVKAVYSQYLFNFTIQAVDCELNPLSNITISYQDPQAGATQAQANATGHVEFINKPEGTYEFTTTLWKLTPVGPTSVQYPNGTTVLGGILNVDADTMGGTANPLVVIGYAVASIEITTWDADGQSRIPYLNVTLEWVGDEEEALVEGPWNTPYPNPPSDAPNVDLTDDDPRTSFPYEIVYVPQTSTYVFKQMPSGMYNITATVADFGDGKATPGVVWWNVGRVVYREWNKQFTIDCSSVAYDVNTWAFDWSWDAVDGGGHLDNVLVSITNDEATMMFIGNSSSADNRSFEIPDLSTDSLALIWWNGTYNLTIEYHTTFLGATYDIFQVYNATITPWMISPGHVMDLQEDDRFEIIEVPVADIDMVVVDERGNLLWDSTIGNATIMVDVWNTTNSTGQHWIKGSPTAPWSQTVVLDDTAAIKWEHVPISAWFNWTWNKADPDELFYNFEIRVLWWQNSSLVFFDLFNLTKPAGYSGVTVELGTRTDVDAHPDLVTLFENTTVSMRLADPNDNPLPDQTLGFLTQIFYLNQTSTTLPITYFQTNSSGQASIEFEVLPGVAAINFEAFFNGAPGYLPSSDLKTVFTVAKIYDAFIEATPSTPLIPLGGSTELTVVLTREDGVPLGGRMLRFYAPPEENLFLLNESQQEVRILDVVTDENGRATVTMKAESLPAVFIDGIPIAVIYYGEPIYYGDITAGVVKARMIRVGVQVAPPVNLGDWPMFHGDLQHTGYRVDPVTPPLEPVWSIDVGAHWGASPAVKDGILYIGGSGGRIWALNATTGSEIWRSPWLGQQIDSTPAVSDELVCVGTWNATHCLNRSDGSIQWSFYAQHENLSHPGFFIDSSPIIHDGVAYIGLNDGYLYAINATTGIKIWEFNTSAPIKCTPAIYNNKIYFGSGHGGVFHDNHFYAVELSTGELVWNNTLYYDTVSSAAIRDGVVYVGSGPYVYAMDAEDGHSIWEYKMPDGNYIESSPAVTPTTVYISGGDWMPDPPQGALYAINRTDGSLRWTIGTEFTRISPSVAGNIIYLGNYKDPQGPYDMEGRYFYAIDADTGDILWTYPLRHVTESIPALANETVYVAAAGTIYAFRHSEYVLTKTSVEVVPDLATLLDNVTVNIRLTDAKDAPIAGQTMGLLTQIFFLNQTDEVLPTTYFTTNGTGYISLTFNVTPGIAAINFESFFNGAPGYLPSSDLKTVFTVAKIYDAFINITLSNTMAPVGGSQVVNATLVREDGTPMPGITLRFVAAAEEEVYFLNELSEQVKYLDVVTDEGGKVSVSLVALQEPIVFLNGIPFAVTYFGEPIYYGDIMSGVVKARMKRSGILVVS